MVRIVIGLLIAFAVLSALSFVLARFWPAIKGQKVLRRGYGLDLAYWAFTPIVSKNLVFIAFVAVLAPVAVFYGLKPQDLQNGFGPAASLPFWLQAASMLILGDFIGYWSHRAFHATRLWPFHAVHHSSEELDWLSATRLHPVNDVVSKLAVGIPLLAFGFAPTAFAVYAPFVTVYAIMIHANVGWDFGPLRTVIASPAYHRWHHAHTDSGIGQNYAGLLPLWDLIFGTYYFPKTAPTRYGAGEAFPATLWGQLAHPFGSAPAKAISEPVRAAA